MSKEQKKLKVVTKCPVCKCKEYEGVSFDLGSIVFCKKCGCVYKQVIYNPAD